MRNKIFKMQSIKNYGNKMKRNTKTTRTLKNRKENYKKIYV